MFALFVPVDLDELSRKDEIALKFKTRAEEMSIWRILLLFDHQSRLDVMKQLRTVTSPQQRKRVAAQELAEDKIKIVTAAEAEAEKTVGIGLVLPSNGRPLSMDWQTVKELKQ